MNTLTLPTIAVLVVVVGILGSAMDLYIHPVHKGLTLLIHVSLLEATQAQILDGMRILDNIHGCILKSVDFNTNDQC